MGIRSGQNIKIVKQPKAASVIIKSNDNYFVNIKKEIDSLLPLEIKYSNFSKISERDLKKQVVNYLLNNNLLNDFQIKKGIVFKIKSFYKPLYFSKDTWEDNFDYQLYVKNNSQRWRIIGKITSIPEVKPQVSPIIPKKGQSDNIQYTIDFQLVKPSEIPRKKNTGAGEEELALWNKLQKRRVISSSNYRGIDQEWDKKRFKKLVNTVINSTMGITTKNLKFDDIHIETINPEKKQNHTYKIGSVVIYRSGNKKETLTKLNFKATTSRYINADTKWLWEDIKITPVKI